MAEHTWPDFLPLPEVAGYGVRPESAFIRTDMEAGTARQRRRFTQVPSRFPVNWTMDQDQYALFEGFWELTEFGGAWHNTQLKTGLGLLDYEARFIQPYESEYLGAGNWRISSVLEVRKVDSLSAGDTGALIANGTQNSIDAFPLLDTLVNTTMPNTLG